MRRVQLPMLARWGQVAFEKAEQAKQFGPTPIQKNWQNLKQAVAPVSSTIAPVRACTRDCVPLCLCAFRQCHRTSHRVRRLTCRRGI